MTTVTCRPGNVWIVSATLLTLYGGLIVVGTRLAPQSMDDPVIGATWIVALPLAALIALFCATSRVVADERGLRWTRFGFGRSVPWSGVHEYHLQDTQGAARKPFLVIQTEVGRLVVPDLWTHQADLKALLIGRALGVVDEEWGVLARDGKSQRVFEYHVRRLALARWASIIGIALYLGLVFHRVPAQLADTLQDLGPLMTTALFVLVLAIAASVAAFVYCGFIIAINDGIQRRHERVLVDPEGIMFQDGKRTVCAPWVDVLSVRVVRLGGLAYGKKRVIVTSSGEFEYTRMIRDAMRLDAIIKRFAISATYTIDTNGDVIGAESAIQGARVYHYRTYTNRALLIFPLGFVLIAVVIAVLQAQGLAESRNPNTPWIMGIGAFAVWALSFWRYRTVSIRTDTLGITRIAPSGKTFIPWSDVKTYRKVGGDMAQFLVVEGSHATIRFWLGISNASALVEEIQSHSGLAEGA